MKRQFFSAPLITTSLLFAIGLFGCSDDDEKGSNAGSVVSCEQYLAIGEQCYVQYSGAYDACNGNSECADGVGEQVDTCFEALVCAGMDSEACSDYYAQQCDLK